MDRFKKFMEDRTGVDHLSLALLILSIVLVLIGMVFRWSMVRFLSLIPLVLCYYRAFSKNKLKRHQENILFFDYLINYSNIVISFSISEISIQKRYLGLLYKKIARDSCKIQSLYSI